jgi:hypothetical protein
MPEDPFAPTPPESDHGSSSPSGDQAAPEAPDGGDSVQEPALAAPVTPESQGAFTYQPADPSWAPPPWGYADQQRPSEDIDPAAATGPPWPRLVAAGGGYSPPRLVKWPIVLGVILLIAQITGSVLQRVNTSNSPSAAPYVLSATDAQFIATFPGKPTRTAETEGSTSVIIYLSTLSDHAIGVTYVPLSTPGAFNLDDAINGAAQGVGGTISSRTTVTYQGQFAEDAVISVADGTVHLRAVVFGSAGYLLEGVDSNAPHFAQDYDQLLTTFSSTAPST